MSKWLLLQQQLHFQVYILVFIVSHLFWHCSSHTFDGSDVSGDSPFRITLQLLQQKPELAPGLVSSGPKVPNSLVWLHACLQWFQTHSFHILFQYDEFRKKMVFWTLSDGEGGISNLRLVFQVDFVYIDIPKSLPSMLADRGLAVPELTYAPTKACGQLVFPEWPGKLTGNLKITQ